MIPFASQCMGLTCNPGKINKVPVMARQTVKKSFEINLEARLPERKNKRFRILLHNIWNSEYMRWILMNAEYAGFSLNWTHQCAKVLLPWQNRKILRENQRSLGSSFCCAKVGWKGLAQEMGEKVGNKTPDKSFSMRAVYFLTSHARSPTQHSTRPSGRHNLRATSCNRHR